MAPQSILKSTGTRATKPISPLSEKFKSSLYHPSCNCSREMARAKVQLRFFLRQLIHTIGAEAVTDMFKGFHIPLPTIQNLFEAEVHTFLLSSNKAGSLPKDVQGKPLRTVVPSDLTIVKDEVVEDEKKKLKKVQFKKADGPKERIFIDLTLDD